MLDILGRFWFTIGMFKITLKNGTTHIFARLLESNAFGVGFYGENQDHTVRLFFVSEDVKEITFIPAGQYTVPGTTRTR